MFDAISTLITIDTSAQECCGFHASASITIGPNKKVPKALVPQCSKAIVPNVLPPGQVSVSPRAPIDRSGLVTTFNNYLDGTLIPTDANVTDAIHILDMDFTDVDNCISMLTLQKALHNGNNRHPLFVFVSVRKMSAQLAPLQVQRDASTGRAMKTKEGKMQFKVCNGTPTTFVLTDNVGPYIKEQSYESTFHNQKDMLALHSYAAAVCTRQLQLQYNNNCSTSTSTSSSSSGSKPMPMARVGKLGMFELAGLSHNVHKLEWFMYNKDGSYRNSTEYTKDVANYFNIGIHTPTGHKSEANAVETKQRTDTERETETERENKTTPSPEHVQHEQNPRTQLFHDIVSDYGTEPTTSVEEMMEYLRNEKNKNAPIIVHCAGPMFMLNALSVHPDLAQRITRIGSMFLAHDGEANLLGRNFNEGVCPAMTEQLWGVDGQNIHRLFPNAEILCITTETCKSEGLTFTP